MNYPEIHLPEIYNHFKEIEPQAYHKIIDYFEKNEARIFRLEFEKQFEILIAYLDALYESGKFIRLLDYVDDAIEASVFHNIKYFNGTDIYRHLLLQKAVACFKTLQYEPAERILKALLKMNPSDETARVLLYQNLVRNHPPFLHKMRGGAVLIFMASAAVIALELLAIRPFLPALVSVVEPTRNGLFLLGWAVYLLGEVKHRWHIRRRIQRFIRSLG